MSEPIVERIAQWLLAALQEITVAGGYQYTLKVSRPLNLEGTTASVGDLTTLIELGEQESAGKGTQTHRHKRRRFWVTVYFVGSDEAAAPLDQRIARVEADLGKRMGIEMAAHQGSDRMCGGLAYSIEVEDSEMWIDQPRNAAVLVTPIAISYKHKIENPYEQ